MGDVKKKRNLHENELLKHSIFRIYPSQQHNKLLTDVHDTTKNKTKINNMMAIFSHLAWSNAWKPTMSAESMPWSKSSPWARALPKKRQRGGGSTGAHQVKTYTQI